LVLGGDGTMLHAIRQYWRLRLPFVGINTGHLGFLLNQNPFESLDNLAVVTYQMPMLNAVVEAASGELLHDLAFSDAWIERQSGQAAWLRLDVNGETRVPKLVGDGLLVATPSGSSSYARAMGASPVPLDSQSLTVAGSNVFQPRFWKTLIIPADATVQMTTRDVSGKRPVQAFIDGVPLGTALSLSVSRSNTASVELGFTQDSDLSSKLLASLFPNEVENF
jgi:NAD+ kinase